MLWYEIKKLILKPAVIVFLLLFSIINIYKIYEHNRTVGFSSSKEEIVGLNKIYPKVKGEITQEKIDFINAEIKRIDKEIASGHTLDYSPEDTYSGYIFIDKRIFSEIIVANYEHAFFYENKVFDIYNKTNSAIEFYQNYDNSYDVI